MSALRSRSPGPVEGNLVGGVVLESVSSVCRVQGRHAQTRLSCDGDPGTLRDAIFAYNHARWYVDRVVALAHRYAALPLTGTNAGAGSYALPVAAELLRPAPSAVPTTTISPGTSPCPSAPRCLRSTAAP